MFRTLHCFNDLAERGFHSEPFGTDLKAAGLVDGAGVHFAAGHLFARHRLARNRGLLNKRMSADNLLHRREFCCRVE